MYIAIHYTKVNGTVYTPGEVITEDMTAEEAARLERLGAVRTSEAPFLAPDTQAEEPTDKPDESGDEGGSGADGTPDEGEAPDADAGDDDGEDYEDAEAPEIDVADSISAPDEEPEEPQEKKPAPRRKGRKE